MTDINNGKIIAIAGNQSAAIDVCNSLIKAGYIISYFLNVGPEKEHMISDYHDLSRYAEENGIQLLRPVKYTMLDEKTKKIFADLRIDFLISVGWQRLIREWLINTLYIGSVGMHWSSEPLPKGLASPIWRWTFQ